MKEICSGQWLTCQWHRLSMTCQLQGLQAARWTCIIEVKSPFLIRVALHPVAVKYEPIISHWGLYTSEFHLMKHNGATWHRARQSIHDNFFVTKIAHTWHNSTDFLSFHTVHNEWLTECRRRWLLFRCYKELCVVILQHQEINPTTASIGAN